ncbi:RNA-directed DNA polymerase, eukaryota, reverse transcriptase zinc-binding domain protein, partial [Tanacetum coccineum]
MGSKRSVADEVMKISTSVFVTNFPVQVGAKELWHACKQYGQVVDAFIPNRKSKLGKRFGFVRFIKVFDAERLANNLCTVWIGSHRLHANIARFQRPTGQNTSKYSGNSVDKRKNTAKVSINHGRNIKPNSFVHAVKGSNPGITINNETPTMVLDDDCVNQEDYSHCLNGKIKDFEALTNLKTILGNEGFNDVVLRYLGGMWVMLMFKSMEEKEIFKLNVGIGSWFSKIIQTTHDFISHGRCLLGWRGGLYQQEIIILTAAKDNIMETIKITFKGKSYWLRVKEVPGGVPISKLSKGRSMNLVPETIFEDGKDKNIGVEVSFGNLEIQSEDPFNLYPLLVKKKGENLKDTSNSASLKFPPGFTPSSEEEAVINRGNKEIHNDGPNGMERDQWDDNHDGLEQSDAMNKGTESVGSGCTKKASSMHSGGSLLHVMDELIKETKMESIDLFDIRRCWGNFTFDYAHELPEKQTLWDYIGHAINSWKGEVIIMGDFNEVHYKNERFGSIFNVQGANAFNSFIGKAGLEEVPLGGCTFTWCHKSASKMSKLDRFLISESLLISCPNISAITLDRFLSDHRPILLRESSFDYGPTPFWF